MSVENDQVIVSSSTIYGNGVLVDVDYDLRKGLLITCRHNVTGNIPSLYSPLFPNSDLIGEVLDEDERTDLAALVVFGPGLVRMQAFNNWRSSEVIPEERGMIYGLRGDDASPYNFRVNFGDDPCERSSSACNREDVDFSIDEITLVGDSGSLVVDRFGKGVGLIKGGVYDSDKNPLFSVGISSTYICYLRDRVLEQYEQIK